MSVTLDYYNNHADAFIHDTAFVDFTDVQDRFLCLLPNGGRILDFGCGSGRDALYFHKKGFIVDAVDGSERLCALRDPTRGYQFEKCFSLNWTR